MHPGAKQVLRFIVVPAFALLVVAELFTFTVRRYWPVWLAAVLATIVMVVVRGRKQKRIDERFGFAMRADGREMYIDRLYDGTKWLSIYCELGGGDIDRVVHLSSVISTVPKNDREAFTNNLRDYLAASRIRAEIV